MASIKKKIWPKYFTQVKSGKKRFQLRLADFKIKEGDILILEEWDSHLWSSSRFECRLACRNTVFAVFGLKLLEFFGYAKSGILSASLNNST